MDDGYMAAGAGSAAIRVDCTHMARRASGIERITRELFTEDALAPLHVSPYSAAGSRASIVRAQMIGLPISAIRDPAAVFVFPGYPPSPFFSLVPHRSVLFVHDLFLLTRRHELNRAARHYMAPMFGMAVKRFSYFLTNSEYTASQLRQFCASDATVMTYRPRIRNVFGLSASGRGERVERPKPLMAVAIGTVEPRKNLVGAADICAGLSRRLSCDVELHVIGRFGWGDDARELARRPYVKLHGYQADAEARAIIDRADIMICASHDEGLGLPLLEVQYGGLPVVAPDAPIFREVLGRSGILVDPAAPEMAATIIASAVEAPGWRRDHAARAAANLEMWNRHAETDRTNVIGLLGRLSGQQV